MTLAVARYRGRRSRRTAPDPRPFNLEKALAEFVPTRDEIPDIMEFTLSDEYLDKPNLYPRQATLLKVAFLQDELFTDYDHEVIGEWINNYTETHDNGIQPDIYERIEINKREGRPWFREWLSVIGRRGSKGYIGAIAGSYVLYHYLKLGNPQEYYGIDQNKQLAAFVFAAKKEQAVTNQWGDLSNMIISAPCFTEYVGKPLGESLSIRSEYDDRREAEREMRGIYAEGDISSFMIQAKESTKTAGRGPAGFMQFYDEMAHAVKGVAKSDIGEVYDAATPALDQFGMDAFIYEPSSPWQMVGKFYENYQRSIATNDDGTPTNPQMLMIQLTSWDIYTDWERAHEIPVVPATLNPMRGKHQRRHPPHFRPMRGPMQAYTLDLQREEAANPETFAVERRARFATVMDAYLNPERVDSMFEDWVLVKPDGTEVMRHLVHKARGALGILYKAHGDPSKSGANFGWAIAHREGPDINGMYHVVFDRITHWEPQSFPENNHEIDYIALEGYFKQDIASFVPTEVSFDQFNSIYTMQNLRKFVREHRLPRRVEIFERTSTAPVNWRVAETFKTSLGMGLVHAPPYEQASLELKFLQKVGVDRVDHPTAGPVQTKDVADCLMILTHALIGEQVAAFIGQSLANLTVLGSSAGGFPKHNEERDETADAFARFSRRRTAGVGERPMRSSSGGRRGAPTGSPARRRFRQ